MASKPVKPKKKQSHKGRRIGYSIIVFIIVALIILNTAFQSSGSTGSVENFVSSLFTPVQSAFSSVSGLFKSWFGISSVDTSLEQQLIDLQQEYDKLKIEYSGYEELEKENERLKTLLDAKSEYEALDPIYAKVIAKDTGVWFNTFTINRGSNDQISLNMAVVSVDGLIGRISKVGLNYSVVTTIIDSRSSIAALVSRTRDNGMLRGNTEAADGSIDLRMYYISNLGGIKVGDSVYTSGLDSMFPKGIYIGTVSSISRSSNSSDKYLTITPSANFASIEEVYVLREEIASQSDPLSPVVTPTPVPVVTAKPTTTTGIYAVATQSAVDDNAIYYLPTPTPDPNVTPTPSPTPAPSKPVPEAAWVNE